MVTRLFAVHRNAGSHVTSPDSQMKNTNAETLVKYLNWIASAGKLVLSHHAILTTSFKE